MDPDTLEGLVEAIGHSFLELTFTDILLKYGPKWRSISKGNEWVFTKVSGHNISK